jgi:hypothetical protein
MDLEVEQPNFEMLQVLFTPKSIFLFDLEENWILFETRSLSMKKNK